MCSTDHTFDESSSFHQLGAWDGVLSDDLSGESSVLKQQEQENYLVCVLHSVQGLVLRRPLPCLGLCWGFPLLGRIVLFGFIREEERGLLLSFMFNTPMSFRLI